MKQIYDIRHISMKCQFKAYVCVLFSTGYVVSVPTKTPGNTFSSDDTTLNRREYATHYFFSFWFRFMFFFPFHPPKIVFSTVTRDGKLESYKGILKSPILYSKLL